MHDASLAFLHNLLNTPSPSGYERPIQDVVRAWASPLSIFITAAHERTRRFTPWTIPPLFAWLVWWEAPLSGASTNPARSFGPALISGLWGDFWIYLLAPAVGAALGIALIHLKLFGEHHIEVARVARHD